MRSILTLGAAQAACAGDFACGGVTSQHGGVPPWETRHNTKTEVRLLARSHNLSIKIATQTSLLPRVSRSPQRSPLSRVTLLFRMIYLPVRSRVTTSIINSAVAPTTVLPPGRTLLHKITVLVTTFDAALRFGIDESFTLTVTTDGTAMRPPMQTFSSVGLSMTLLLVHLRSILTPR